MAHRSRTSSMQVILEHASYFALIFANSCPSPLLIIGSICEKSRPALFSANWASLCPIPPWSVLQSGIYRTCALGLCGLLSCWTYCSFYLLSHKTDYALFLGFSDLVSVGGILPSVLQTPPTFSVLADPKHLQHFCWSCSNCPCDHNTWGPLQTFQLAMSMPSREIHLKTAWNFDKNYVKIT